MNSLKAILARKLTESDPTIDVHGSDRKILQIACQDFTNYLKFTWNLSGKETGIDNIIEKTEQFVEEPGELESFLVVWTGLWLKKWKNRVKLVLGNQSQNNSNQINKILSTAEPLWKELECRQELVEILTSALIRNGEICGTEILAERLLKVELGKKSNQHINKKEQIFAVLNDAIRKAREMTQITGPLIFIRIEKGYFTQQTPQEITKL